MKRTAVLVSRENFVWHSMQEIIPSLQECWQASARAHVHEVEAIDIDSVSLTDAMPALVQADNIVLTSFTHKMSRLGEVLRSRLGLEARYIFHVHNQATIGFWPLHRWGLAGVMRSSDVFVSSCDWDARSVPLSFANARTVTVPFTFSSSDRLVTPAYENREPEFAFVGRLSAQKNLDVLIRALAALSKGKLTLFGRADNLGSPNMGLRCEGLDKRLLELAAELGVQDRIRFAGHVSREELSRYLSSQPHIFVSPSTHSDENFGMAAFRSLCMGAPAVLTRWGGHADFEKEFARQIHFVEVESGPNVPVERLAEKMASAFHSYQAFEARVPERYRNENIAERYLQIALGPHESPMPLQPTELALRILQSRAHFESRREACRIFESYQDPNARPFFQSYGMQ